VPERARLLAGGALALTLAGCGGHPATRAKSAGVQAVSVHVGSGGCTPSSTSLRVGAATFTAQIEDGNTVTEVELLQRPIILAELENLATTRSQHRFSLELPPGRIVLYCPGGKATRTSIAVTGTAAAAMSPRRLAAVARYRRWVETQAQALVNATLVFTQALHDGNLAQAEALYPRARVYYERVEPIAESFSTLDKRIDARAGDVPASQWTGFHPLERELWTRGTTRGTDALAAQLVADVSAVNSVATRLKLTPSQIANGAVELLNEVAQSKITGEEERYSHLDLVDFEANVEGARAAFDAVRPLLPARYSPLAGEISSRFDDVESALAPYRRGASFVRYTELDDADTRALSRAVDALAEPLSRVSGLVLAR
jgi:iron uptake system EfeUOB component EfeO/EfeM